MAGSFSLGVVIGASLSSNFTSAMLGTQRAMKKLESGTGILKRRQQELLDKSRRYGISGEESARRVRNEYQRLGREVEKLTRLQSKLTDVTSKSKILREQRGAIIGQTTSFVARVAIAAKPVIKAVKGYAEEESLATSIAQGTGNFSPAFKQHLIQQARKTSMDTAQSNSTILSIMDTLTDAQWQQSDIDKVTTLIGRTATTYKQDASVFTETAETLAKTFGYTSDQMQHAFNLLAKGGNTVGFEFPDLAPALGELGQYMQKSGVTGDEALKEIMAAAGTARKTMNKSEVMGSMKSWLESIDKDRLKSRYQAMGVEYERSRADYAKAGYSDFESSVIIAKRYLDAKGGGDFAKKFQALDGQAEAQQALIENFGMGQVFTSPEQIKFLNAMIKGGDSYQKNKAAISHGQDDSYINKNYGEHAKTLGVQMTLLKNQVASAYSVLGEQLAPGFKQNLSVLQEWVKNFADFIGQHPKLIQSAATIAKYFVMIKAFSLVFKLAGNGALSVFNLWRKLTTLGQTWSKLSATAIRYGKTMTRLAKGARSLGKMLGGGLLKGLMLAGRAVLFLGRAMLMNPAGLIITGIAVAAFLIYKYWQPISGFFKRLWIGVKTVSVAVWQGISRFFSGFFTVQVAGFKRIWGAVTGFFSELWSRVTSLFSGGIGSMAKVIINWSPVGLFHKCFAGVLGYFGVDLPASFTEFGKNLIHGLVDGITATFGKVKDTITSVADSVKDTFKGWLGINSPSTVFMGYGGNISEGLAIGIEGKKNIAASAIKSLHSEIEAPLPPKMGKIGVAAGAAGRPGAAGGANTGDIHLTFSPVIHTTGTARDDIAQAMRLCLPELEKTLREILYQQQRRSFSAA